MICQLVNKRTKILAIATSPIANVCNYYNHVFTLLISMPRFKSINFYQNWPKFKLFLQTKYKIFERYWLRSQAPHTAPFADFWLRACLAEFQLRCGGDSTTHTI